MFCTQCGNEIEQQARFCSKCGQVVTAATTATAAPAAVTAGQRRKRPRDMDTHINVLGWLFVGTGILTGAFGMIVLFAGGILTRLPGDAEIPAEELPFILWIMSVVGMCILAVAVAAAAAGVGLLQYRTWGPTFAIIMAVLLLVIFPVGTGVAIYTFWVLVSEEGRKYYKTRSESTMAPSGF